ncbi:hypothetical protein YT1_0081 [Rhodococcus ruber]|nr:hypothetical protein YT1_0081 [Rhodococcus ruber]
MSRRAGSDDRKARPRRESNLTEPGRARGKRIRAPAPPARDRMSHAIDGTDAM